MLKICKWYVMRLMPVNACVREHNKSEKIEAFILIGRTDGDGRTDGRGGEGTDVCITNS